MIATIVHVWVKPEFRTDFLSATIENHDQSIKENGNLRFDVLVDDENENKFTLYEAYEKEEYAIEHKKTPHYLKWRETVEKMMAKPREGVKHSMLKH